MGTRVEDTTVRKYALSVGELVRADEGGVADRGLPPTSVDELASEGAGESED